MNKKTIFSVALISGLFALPMSAREHLSFDKGWLFTLADSAGMWKADYADAHWRSLNLPHDWAIEGDFSPGNPSGASGGALPGGIGWYRKHFSLNPHEKYDRFTITFDGVYMNSTVYINGHQLGTRPYGYSTFEYDLTPYINRKGDNVIAVKVDNSDQPNSRWYSGCGIYRHVWLTKTMKKAYIPQWGQYVSTTPQGDVRVKTDFAASGNRMKLFVRNTIYDAAGKIVAKSKGDQEQKLQVKNPHLWDIGKGYLYTVKSELVLNGKVVDVATTTTGFRDVKFDARKGFFLNGRNIKLNGVCEHHDFGCLGAAVNEDAMHRKLTILRNMGVNAIRSSHNPPAPELLNMCDSMGILVMDESFSALQTRGFYMMPSDSIYSAPKEWWLPYCDPSFKCSAYDNMHASWSSTHEETWDVVKHHDFVGGQFIWTGFDYIGEPTPYAYPARSSYFGIIDLAGLPKDSYFMYQSEWTQKNVLHLFPHWNWIPGQTIDMWCYYNNADEVELFVNGKSQGVRKKTVYGEKNEGEAFRKSTEYHVMWRVDFQPGEVKVVARKDGKLVGEQTIRTAGAPHHIVLKKTYQGNLAYGSAEPTTFVEVNVVDKDGNLCPNAENQIFFSSDAQILGTDNGCQTSLERFTDPHRKAFFGKCVVVLKGKGKLQAKAVDLKEAALEL
jgi:beta-galactosidase/beta-glucuronidase